jgi:hypothetical protein
MILFKDPSGLKLLRARQDGSGFQLMLNVGRWEDFDINAHINEGKASAARNEISYRASYIINKIGLVYDLRKGGQVAIPGQSNLQRKYVADIAFHEREYCADRPKVPGKHAGDYFVSIGVFKNLGSKATTDNSVEFLNALDVTHRNKSQILADLFANLGEPVEVLRLKTSKDTEFILETHPIILTKYDDFNTPIVTHYCLYDLAPVSRIP